MGSLKRQLEVSAGIIVGAFIVVSVALYFLSNEVTAQADKIVADRAHLAEENAALSILASLKSDATQAAPYEAVMEKLLPDHSELVGLPQALNTLGQAHNVSISFAFQGGSAVATAATPGTDGFSLNATGAPTDLAAFLNDLEAQASGFLIAVDSFDLANSGGSYRLTVQGKVFSR